MPFTDPQYLQDLINKNRALVDGHQFADVMRPNNRYETFARGTASFANAAPLASGRLSLQAIWLPSALTVHSISFFSSATAGATLTNQLFALYNSSLALLRQTVNDVATAWAASSEKNLALTSDFITIYSGLYYLGVMVAATTVPTLLGTSATTGGNAIYSLGSSVGGPSNTGLTTIAPDPANAPAAVAFILYGNVVY